MEATCIIELYSWDPKLSLLSKWKNMKLLLVFTVISSFFFCFFYGAAGELIKALPGQPANVAFKQYSGYIVTEPQHGRALFYYFVEVGSANPLLHPLTLWLNGGPGCSSLGFGAFMENGPFQPGESGHLIKNKYSWNLESNMLYLESPIGVGFSYSNTSSDYLGVNDTITAKENLQFLLNWFKEFPHYRDSALYLSGESYAGHYIPQLAALILNYNKRLSVRPIKLKAIAVNLSLLLIFRQLPVTKYSCFSLSFTNFQFYFLVILQLGNPLLDLEISVNNDEFLWSHGVISDEMLMLRKIKCNEPRYLKESIHQNLSKECIDVLKKQEEEMGSYTDPGDLILPICLSPTVLGQTVYHGALKLLHAKLAMRSGVSTDPCLADRIHQYLNSPKVQEAFHANTTRLPSIWEFCGGHLVYQRENLGINILPLLSKLLRSRIPLLLFNGDQDSKIPLTQTRIIANMLAKELKFVRFGNYAPWYDKMQVGGWSQSFGRARKGKNVTYLTFATVRGAAHEVPYTSPSEALTLFRAFLRGSPLPRTRV
ncbi:serine carboxypeptidase-like 45 isoform X2 [Durio zibethinus]|uniref:Carboxypeptidase n=1 Tax=Durio zibethinus TaxID=66656 RepID=A0A6P6BIM4_DURZI|nr:serine carboxypeptidase-like 45 isoform X2 [Durio zibethinus]